MGNNDMVVDAYAAMRKVRQLKDVVNVREGAKLLESIGGAEARKVKEQIGTRIAQDNSATEERRDPARSSRSFGCTRNRANWRRLVALPCF
jgi:hypothetical protein